jgi:hypothetical protein
MVTSVTPPPPKCSISEMKTRLTSYFPACLLGVSSDKEPSQNNFSKFTLLLYDIYAREPHGLHGNTWLSW